MPDRSRTRRPKHPDVNQLAKFLVEEATREPMPEEGEAAAPASAPEPAKDPAAVALGRRGGLKGGKARAARMTPEERQEAAKKAAAARWKPDR